MARFFIDRPIFAWVITIILMLAGILTLRGLPVEQYPDIAALVGIGPRQVGWVMRHYGSNVAWWRVVNASGDHAPFHRQRAFEIWADEGIEVKPNGLGCRIRDYRADLTELAAARAAHVGRPDNGGAA